MQLHLLKQLTFDKCQNKRGFTLVELLVVITIMGLVGVYILSNYNSFGEDQKLKHAALDVQSLLRQAQSNATSKLKCQGQDVLDWRVIFTSTASLDLKCQNSAGISSSLKPLTFPVNISIDSLTSGVNTCTSNQPEAVFVPLYGTAKLINCGMGAALNMTIILKNSKTNNTKTIVIEQGGRIYGQ